MTPKEVKDDVLSNPQLYDLLEAKISGIVQDQIQRRTASVRAWTIGIATVIAGIAFFVGSIVVERAVSETVKATLNDEIGSVQFDARLAALDLRATILDSKSAFEDHEAEHLIDEVKILYSQTSQPAMRDKLLYAIETAATNFYAADRFDYITQVADAAPLLAGRSNTVIQALLQVAGFRLISDPGAPRSWTDEGGVMRNMHDKYVEYTQAATESRYEHQHLFFEFLLGHVEGRPSKELQPFADDIDALETGHRQQLRTMFHAYASGTSTENAGPSERASGHTLAAMCRFHDNELFHEILVEVGHHCHPRDSSKGQQ